MTESDKELLEAAAKAYGIRIAWDFDGPELAAANGKSTSYKWNPLTDDGDALRLAVKWGFNVDIAGDVTEVSSMGRSLSCVHNYDDPNAGTRLAIVRAAAEIGRAMP